MIHLGVLMTRGVGFHEWKRSGLLSREISLYQNLDSIKTTFFHDEKEKVDYEGFQFLPISDMDTVDLNLIKSNQADGAHRALELAQRRSIPFIFRCGYSWANFQQKRAINRLQKWSARRYEGRLVRESDVCVVSSRNDKEAFIENHKVTPEKIRIHPNWVNTESWVPASHQLREKKIITVGRLVDQKNQDLLIQAVAQLEGASLEIYGEGPLKEALLKKARDLQVDLKIYDPVDHAVLKEKMKGAHVFALTSKYEGMPKVLLEAMALELPIVTTKVQGLDDILKNDESGIVVDSTSESVAGGIARALSDSSNQMGQNARRRIIEKFSLQRARELEVALILELMNS